MRLLTKIWTYLDSSDQKKLCWFGILSLCSPAAALFSVSKLIPILNKALDGMVTSELLAEVFFLAVVFLLIGGFELLKIRSAAELIMDVSHSWSIKIYMLYFMEGLGDHNKRSPAQARVDIRDEVSRASALIAAMVRLAVNCLVLAAYFGVLVYIAQWAGAVCCAAVLVMIAVLYWWNRMKVMILGEKARSLEIKISGIISTAYGAYKELKIDSRRDRLREKYAQASAEYAQMQKDYSCMAGIQGIVLENLLEAGLLLLLAYLLVAGVNLARILPEAMALLLLLIRTIPAAKSIVSGLSALRFEQKYLEGALKNLERYQCLKKAEAEREMLRMKRVTLQNGIRVRGLTFRYPEGKLILDQADIDIPAGKSTAVLGPSGEGKTTFLDLVLGLLRPEKGHIWYDDYDIVTGTDCDGPCRADLGKLVSYIPQVVYLNNETVRNNVVFASEGDAEESRIIDCLQCAQIWDDVRQMPDGLDTLIGENGTAISGGQRQRIALARALYKDSDILIMDEATASLDTETERAVLDAIRQLRGSKTLLMVTHHMNLAEACEHVYRIEDRKLKKIR